MGRQLENVLGTPVLLQSTLGLVKSGSDSSTIANLEFSRRFVEMEALIQRIPGVSALIKRSNVNSFADSPFVDAIALVEIPKKFSFLNIKQYEGTIDLDDHIVQYK